MKQKNEMPMGSPLWRGTSTPCTPIASSSAFTVTRPPVPVLVEQEDAHVEADGGDEHRLAPPGLVDAIEKDAQVVVDAGGDEDQGDVFDGAKERLPERRSLERQQRVEPLRPRHERPAGVEGVAAHQDEAEPQPAPRGERPAHDEHRGEEIGVCDAVEEHGWGRPRACLCSESAQVGKLCALTVPSEATRMRACVGYG